MSESDLLIHVTDLCRTDPDGAPFEAVGTVEDVVAYLDGPIRAELRREKLLSGDEDIDRAIEQIRAGHIQHADSFVECYDILLARVVPPVRTWPDVVPPASPPPAEAP